MHQKVQALINQLKKSREAEAAAWNLVQDSLAEAAVNREGDKKLQEEIGRLREIVKRMENRDEGNRRTGGRNQDGGGGGEAGGDQGRDRGSGGGGGRGGDRRAGGNARDRGGDRQTSYRHSGYRGSNQGGRSHQGGGDQGHHYQQPREGRGGGNRGSHRGRSDAVRYEEIHVQQATGGPGVTTGGGRIAKRAPRVEVLDSEDEATHLTLEEDRLEREAQAKTTTTEAESTNPLDNMVEEENRARIAKAKGGGEQGKSTRKGEGEEV